MADMFINHIYIMFKLRLKDMKILKDTETNLILTYT